MIVVEIVAEIEKVGDIVTDIVVVASGVPEGDEVAEGDAEGVIVLSDVLVDVRVLAAVLD